MTPQAHSPLPWAFSGCFIDAPDNSVALIHPDNSRIEEDAKLIVTAVNSHSALVSALEGLMLAQGTSAHEYSCALEVARAILAQVKGGK